MIAAIAAMPIGIWYLIAGFIVAFVVVPLLFSLASRDRENVHMSTPRPMPGRAGEYRR